MRYEASIPVRGPSTLICAVGALLLVAASAGGLRGQGPEPVALDEPVARAAEAFTHVFDVAELPDGRLLVTDSQETTIALVDFDARTVERIGRRGQGPREYASTFAILPAPAGSHRVYDGRQRRFVIVSAEGSIVGTERFTRPETSNFGSPRGPDNEGRLYVRIQERDGGDAWKRRAKLYRWDHESGAVTPVTAIMMHGKSQPTRGFTPMPRGDAWTLLPDGSVARIVAEDYHVEWSGGGRGAVIGPTIPHPRVRVGDDEREAWIRTMRAAPRATASLKPGDESSSGSTREADRTARRLGIRPEDYPEFVPPFERGYVPAAPGSEIWLKLNVASDERRSVFDVLDREGHLVRRVSVDGEARIVGFGPGSVYLVRRDDLDREWIEMYERPSWP